MERPSLPAPYEAVRLLGQGAMGSVWLARDVSLKRNVAVKLLDEGLAEDHGQRERFLREARLAAGLDHPNVLGILDAGVDGHRPYIVMELVEGGSLREAMDGGLTLAAGLPRIVEVARALEAAEKAGVMHRDLKPANVMLDGEGRVRVADWGLAKSVADTQGLTRTGALMGTPSYMAPEQVRGENVSPAVDRYALGVMLFELATGRPPFVGKKVGDVLTAHLIEEAPRLRSFRPDLPEGLDGLVARCLAKDPALRPSAGELAHVLELLEEDVVAGAGRLSGVRTLPASSRKAEATATPSASSRGPSPPSGDGAHRRGPSAPSGDGALRRGPSGPSGDGARRRGPYCPSGDGALRRDPAVALPPGTGPSGAPAPAATIRFPVLLVGLFIGGLVLGAGLFFVLGGPGREGGTAPGAVADGGTTDGARLPFVVKDCLQPEPRLVEIRHEGRPTGRWTLELLDGEGWRLPVDMPPPFDFAASRAVSRRVRALRLAVPWTLHRPRTLRLVSEGGSPVLTMPIAPWSGAEDLLARIDSLLRGDFPELLRRVNVLRGELVKVYEGVAALPDAERSRRRQQATKDAAEGLRRLLVEAGLAAKDVDRLAAELPALLHGGCWPHDPIARRVFPLRLVEAALSDHDRSPPPWGNVSGLLGVRFMATDRIASVQGWEQLGRRSFLRPLPARGEGAIRWVWLTAPDYLEALKRPGQEVLQFSMHLPELFRTKRLERSQGEVFPDSAADVVDAYDGLVELRPSIDHAWPPERVMVDLVVRLFDRSVVLVLRLNDSPPVRVLQTSFFNPPPHWSSLRSWRIAVPFHPRWARVGKNSLNIAVEGVPGSRVVHLISLKEAAIRAHWPGMRYGPEGR